MCDITAEQLVFVDESLFKAQTCWRSMAYGPIGDPTRWNDDIRKGDTWSVLPAYTINRYLPYTAIRKGYFNTDAFLAWVMHDLLPLWNPYPGPCSMICLDNASSYIDPHIQQAIEDKGLLIRYLPPYSLDYSPIELTFSVLKSWVRPHFIQLRAEFKGNFGGFLQYAISHSGCDRFAVEHFRHSPGGYQFEGDYKAVQRELSVAEIAG